MIDLTRGTAHDVFSYNKNPLDVIFSPRSVALIGATEREGSVGRTIVWNLHDQFVWRHHLPCQPNRAQRDGHQSVPQHWPTCPKK
jgi:acetyltransferase